MIFLCNFLFFWMLANFLYTFSSNKKWSKKKTNHLEDCIRVQMTTDREKCAKNQSTQWKATNRKLNRHSNAACNFIHIWVVNGILSLYCESCFLLLISQSVDHFNDNFRSESFFAVVYHIFVIFAQPNHKFTCHCHCATHQEKGENYLNRNNTNMRKEQLQMLNTYGFVSSKYCHSISMNKDFFSVLKFHVERERNVKLCECGQFWSRTLV